MKLTCLALALLVSPALAHAQAVDLTTPDPIANQLAQARRDAHRTRREAGVALLIGGLASVIGGGVVAGVGHEDPFALGLGLGTATWGAVNAALSIGSLDIGDSGLAEIERDRTLRGPELAALRERELRRHHADAAIFALNLGLDVFYIGSAVLLFFVADQLDDPDLAQGLRGYSVAQMGQGGFLLAFDLVEWIASVGRADAIADVPRP